MPTTASSASAPATRGAGATASRSANFEPGSDIVTRATVLAEGTLRHLTGVAFDRFGLAGESPQVWALGVKEVWRVAEATCGGSSTRWAGRCETGSATASSAARFVYPMGDDMVTLGMVVGMDYRDVELSAHDLLQELKTHRLIRKIVAGGERLAWGAKTIPEGGLLSLPSSLHAPGAVFCGDAAGLVNVPALKGIHYAVESGRLAAEAVFATLQGGETAWRPGALERYDESLRSSFVWKDLRAVRNMRPAFAKGFWRGGMKAGMQTATMGNVPHGNAELERDAEVPLIRTNRAARYPAPDGTLTFDKLSSVYASGNRTRDDQPNHIRIERQVPVEIAELWTRMCPAQVYEVGEADDDGTVEVQVTPSNCVQCGAITGQGRAADAARGRLRARVHAHLIHTVSSPMLRKPASCAASRAAPVS